MKIIKNITTLLPMFLLPYSLMATELIEVSTDNSSMVMKVDDENKLLFRHYGAQVDDITPFGYTRMGNLKEHGTKWHAYSTRGGREFREPALAATYASGELNTELSYILHTTETIDSNVTLTTVKLHDVKQNLDVELYYKAFQDEDVILCSTKITNNGKKDVTLEQFYSSNLPLKANDYHLYHFAGDWASEMQLKHSHLTQGTKTIETKRLVRATHGENPSFVLTLNDEYSEESGKAIIGALAWSGNYKINFEVDLYGYLNILSGINPYVTEEYLEPGESFTTPEMIYTFSEEGVGQASRNMHDWARNYGVWNGKEMQPTLLNSWEGAHFKFDTKLVTTMIDDAAAMGLEMFVLDDGWFGNKYPRNDSRAGLGDWEINKSKIPEGIDFLTQYCAKKGIKFGIWIEPEMVNPESELARKHPEWIVGERGREFTTLRTQLLLDLSNPEVQDFVFKVFDDIMIQSPSLYYIKWDANRHLENIGSTYLDDDKQKEFTVAYVEGLYNVYERIRAKYPNVLIQACASGGGRVEYGALKYHDEVWTSDNTDAVTRAYMQYTMNMIYPSIVTGSHVSASPNGQTKSITTLKFRTDMAMTGRLGFELQPQHMSENEREISRKAIEDYKAIRDIVCLGDLYRLSSPYGSTGHYTILYVSKDKNRAVLFDFCLKHNGRATPPTVALSGLDSDKNYKITELNKNGKSTLWANDKTLHGSFLKEVGLNPNNVSVNSSGVYLLEAK